MKTIWTLIEDVERYDIDILSFTEPHIQAEECLYEISAESENVLFSCS